MKKIALLSALAGSAAVVLAQGTFPPHPLESEIRFEVWNGTSWTSSIAGTPGQQIEYRVVLSYTGARTNLIGLGSARYQVTFSNADNTGPSRDTLASFPGDGTSTYTQNMLSQADGASGGPLARYGRVVYGSPGQTAQFFNRLRNFAHGGDAPQNEAPAGQWLRVAGEFVTHWPAASLPGTPSAELANRVARGVAAGQFGPLGLTGTTPNTNYVAGVQDLVVFRHALTLSDSVSARTIEVSTFEGALNRNGQPANDDRRYISWIEEGGSQGTYRTAVAIVPATIVIPTPGALALLGVTGFVVARRRR
jgi:hypothetical protein